MSRRLPVWFKQEIPDSTALKLMRALRGMGVHTVCAEAACPNWAGCFKNKELTFLILGDTCSRDCSFCAVKKSNGEKIGIDKDEPNKIAKLVKILGLDYVVLTSVCRDDLADGGAEVFARTVKAIRRVNEKIKVEALIPDFQGEINSLQCVLGAPIDVLAHNIETVPRLYPKLRPQADYRRSLDVLKNSKKLKLEIPVKSSIMLGLGEKKEEVIAVMQDIRENNCDCLSLGQYLAPSSAQHPVERFIGIEEFRGYSEIGLGMGFKSVLSGPKMRSSYRAKEVYQCMN